MLNYEHTLRLLQLKVEQSIGHGSIQIGRIEKNMWYNTV